jgi:hypothetical protein
MSKGFARSSATGAAAWDGTWTKGFLVPAADGTVTGVTVGGDAITAFPVIGGVPFDIVEFGSISDAPAGSIVVY